MLNIPFELRTEVETVMVEPLILHIFKFDTFAFEVLNVVVVILAGLNELTYNLLIYASDV